MPSPVQSKARERVEQIVRTVNSISGNLTFPIRSFKELSDALGGEGAEVQHGGERRKVALVRGLIPDAYFPIESREELITKIIDLQSRLTSGWPGPVEAGTELKAPPPDAGRPLARDDAPKPGKGGPAVKGWR